MDDDTTLDTMSSDSEQKLNFIFPLKLYMLLSNESSSTMIRWNEDGRSFVIVDKDELCPVLLTVFCRKFLSLLNFQSINYLLFSLERKFTSFTRQLNIYGFRRVRLGLKSSLSYFHPYFQRGRKDLLFKVVRVPVKSAVFSDSKKLLKSNNEIVPPEGNLPLANEYVPTVPLSNNIYSQPLAPLHSIYYYPIYSPYQPFNYSSFSFGFGHPLAPVPVHSEQVPLPADLISSGSHDSSIGVTTTATESLDFDFPEFADDEKEFLLELHHVLSSQSN